MKVFRLIKICLDESCCKVLTSKYLPREFPVNNNVGKHILPSIYLKFALGMPLEMPRQLRRD
jgi:hypothetical protein